MKKLVLELTGKDVMVALDCSRATANRRLSEVRNKYNLGSYRKVPVTLFCEYFEIGLREFIIKVQSN